MSEERADSPESTVNKERAEPRESTETTERAIAPESTETEERFMTMTTDGNLAGIKVTLHALIESVITVAQEQGVASDELYRLVVAEALVIAAELHDGSDASFLNMAKRSLAVARTGSIEQ